jgi:acyl-[acyl carrier protein]--UDP-N-acetylglucosamine O-acyltransferase
MTARIHPTAVIAKGAELARDVTIGPYSVIGARVKIGEGTVIGPQVVIDGVTTIGRENRFLGQANIGGAPQDLSYEDEPTELEIGDRNTVREFVTINRGTIKGGGVTRVGQRLPLHGLLARGPRLRDRRRRAARQQRAARRARGRGQTRSSTAPRPRTSS